MDPTPEQMALFDEQPLGILATVRKDGSPHLTPINYACHNGQILISITRTRVKYHNIKRNPRVSLCIVKPEGRPYVTVYGHAKIEEQDIVEGTSMLFRRVSDRPLPDNFEESLREQQRVLVKITPERFVP